VVKLSQIVAAAEEAPEDRLMMALRVLLEGSTEPKRVRTNEAIELLGVSRRTITRHGRPLRRIGGENEYDLEELREAVSRGGSR